MLQQQDKRDVAAEKDQENGVAGRALGVGDQGLEVGLAKGGLCGEVIGNAQVLDGIVGEGALLGNGKVERPSVQEDHKASQEQAHVG